MKKLISVNPSNDHSRRRLRNLFTAALFGALPLVLSGCAALGDSPSDQSAYRGPVTAAEVKDALAKGVPQAELIDQIRRRGARTPSSIEIDQLRLSGADHALIDNLLKANHATQYVWVNPPRFSFYWGRGSWYWVNDYGWPVYPQPYGWVYDSSRFYGPHPSYPHPIKPAPRPKAAPQIGVDQDTNKPKLEIPAVPTTPPSRPGYIPKAEK